MSDISEGLVIVRDYPVNFYRVIWPDLDCCLDGVSWTGAGSGGELLEFVTVATMNRHVSSNGTV